MELRESQKETDRMIREMAAKTDRQMEETDRKISRLGDRLGDLIEHLTASNLPEKFEEFNYKFTLISRNMKIKDDKNRILAEIDIFLENGDYAMAVEVKSLLTKTGIKEHIKRMETLRRYADARHDKRKYISSVSGALIEETAKDFALKNGIYVIEHPGETIQIAVPENIRTW
jgi:ElaB/YqjD/DUF883 family membrane-anchored ribosome-binding protein